MDPPAHFSHFDWLQEYFGLTVQKKSFGERFLYRPVLAVED